jgi:hypothetical protein
MRKTAIDALLILGRDLLSVYPCNLAKDEFGACDIDFYWFAISGKHPCIGNAYTPECFPRNWTRPTVLDNSFGYPIPFVCGDENVNRLSKRNRAEPHWGITLVIPCNWLTDKRKPRRVDVFLQDGSIT